MITSVVLAGRDAPLWLAACTLHDALKASGVTVTVVELPGRLREADVYASQPALEALHRLLGIDEDVVLKATRGAFSLGQSFTGFTGPDSRFFHAYGSTGAKVGGHAFFSVWLKARAFGLQVALEDFSLTAAAARQGRMLVPDTTTETFARTDYGYHLPAAAYAAWLKGQATRRGIAVHAARDITVSRDAAGDITALNGTITGDLFIDLTGADALLHGGDSQSWRDLFPCDRVLVAAGPRFDSLPPYAEVRAHAHGWLGFYPSRAATHLVQAYTSRTLSDDAALALAARQSGLKLGDAIVTPSHPGRRIAPWSGNCIALGEAACVFDLVDSADLHAVQTGLVHLLALFPVADDCAAERREYNRVMTATFDRIRDFQLLHYAGRPGVTLPDSLQARIDAFMARGVVPMFDEETFARDSWEAVLTGHGFVPDGYDPRIDRIPGDEIKTQFRTMLGFIKTQVEGQASHDAYLELFAN